MLEAAPSCSGQGGVLSLGAGASLSGLGGTTLPGAKGRGWSVKSSPLGSKLLLASLVPFSLGQRFNLGRGECRILRSGRNRWNTRKFMDWGSFSRKRFFT